MAKLTEKNQPLASAQSINVAWLLTRKGTRRAKEAYGWFAFVCAQLLSQVRLCATLWTAAFQAPLSIGFSRHEYWSGLPCPPPGDLPDPAIELMSFASHALAGRFFTLAPPVKPTRMVGQRPFFKTAAAATIKQLFKSIAQNFLIPLHISLGVQAHTQLQSQKRCHM